MQTQIEGFAFERKKEGAERRFRRQAETERSELLLTPVRIRP